jgi:hypothetical protein
MQGKRVRAPSQAAINSAIAAAQRAAGIIPEAALDDEEDEEDEEEDEGDSSDSSDEESYGRADKAVAKSASKAAAGRAPPPPARVLSVEESVLGELAKAAGGVSVHTDSSWMDAALRVLIKVC